MTADRAKTLPPVVLLVFNRPELIKRVLEPVRLARPPVLLVVGDGPREGKESDKQRCLEVRKVLDEGIDWGPKVMLNFSNANLGCRRRVSTGLTWAFEQVESAIILEDDCVADSTFFRFCAELLDRYKDDTRLGAIGGTNFQAPGFECAASYYFSLFPHCWGWAGWRRAWKLYDDRMSEWPKLRRQRWLDSLFYHPAHARYWEAIFDWVYNNQINSWAYRWAYSCWTQNLLAALPQVNLVTNIGIGPDATHTKEASVEQTRRAQPIDFPLVHPPNFVRHFKADLANQRTIYGRRKGKGLMSRLQDMAVSLGRSGQA